MPVAAILDGVGDHRHRLDGGVQGQQLAPASRVDAWVLPDIGAVAAVLAELEVVDVRLRAVLEHEHQFMLAAVERAHPPVVLDPDTQLLRSAKDRCRGLKQLRLVPPVHEDVQNATWHRERAQVSARMAQEARERLRAHLARGHGELLVLDLAQAPRVPVDLHVVGWVRDDHLGHLAVQQTRVGGFHQGISTKNPVAAQRPEVARAAHHPHRHVLGLQLHVCSGWLDQQVDLDGVEGGQLDLEVIGDQQLDLVAQQAHVPAGQQGQLVVGQDIGPFGGLGETRDDAGGHRCEIEALGNLPACFARQNDAVLIDQDGIGDAEIVDALFELEELLGAVTARVVGPGLEGRGRLVHDAADDGLGMGRSELQGILQKLHGDPRCIRCRLPVSTPLQKRA